MNIDIYDEVIRTRLEANQKILVDDYHEALTSLKNHIKDLEECWQGSDHDYFMKTMEPFLNDLDSLEKSLQSYHEFLAGYLEAVTALISHYASKKITLK